jgi:hypothetical protein
VPELLGLNDFYSDGSSETTGLGFSFSIGADV